MAVSNFLPKTKLFSKAINFRPSTQTKWTPKWTMIRRIGTTIKQQQGITGTTGGSNGGQDRQQGSGKTKGKLNKIKIFRTKWSWRAGAGWTILSVLDWWLLAAGGWLTWKGVVLRWSPLGLCTYAAIQWYLHNKELDKQGLPRTATKWQSSMYCALPLRLVSRGWGWLADCRVPESLRPTVYGFYSTTFGVNLEEAASSDLSDYRSLGEFFARSLKADARFIDPGCLVSPCDGKILHFGPASNNQIEQVKGVRYNIESFLGPSSWEVDSKSDSYSQRIKTNPDSTLYQCIIYLAPGDYHRFHSPTSWQPELRRHFAGELLSVSPKIAQWMPGLFCLNERALYIGKWEHGFFSFTAVGATNVGSVQIYMDEHLKTNKWMGWKLGSYKGTEYEELRLPEGSKLNKGDVLGQFNMGSTIVLIFEAPKDYCFSIEAGQSIKVGEKMLCKVEIEKEKSM